MIGSKLRARLTRQGAVSGLVILLGACAAMHLQAPSVTPTNVELVDAQMFEQHFKVRLHVENPNDRDLPIKSANAKLKIEDVEVGQGETAQPFNVPARGATDFDMIVTTNFATSLPGLFTRIIRGGDLPHYQLSGWVHTDIGMLPPIPFSKSGQIAPQ
jgi:LEA14-like dessication related protein